MSIADVIRALKDPEFRKSLSDAERAKMPAHPAGPIDLTPAQLEVVLGGQMRTSGTTTCGTSTCDIQCE